MYTSQRKNKIRKIKRWKKKGNLKANHHTLNSALQPICQGPLPSFSIETALGLMATKSLVSAAATLEIGRRGGQGREAPGIPGCHPLSRPHVPRLLPPPLAAASARETRRSGADDREGEEGDPRPATTSGAPRSRAHPLSHPQRPQLKPPGRRPRDTPSWGTPDAPSLRTWKFLEIGGNR